MKNKQKEIMKLISDRDFMFSFYISQGFIFLIAIVTGYFLFDSLLELFGLMKFSDYIGISLGVICGLVVAAIDIFLMKRLPKSYYDDGGINERLFTNRGFWRIFWMCALVSFCEELLFRGVIQTHFGLIFTSLIFALVHFRYLFNLFLLINVVALSFFIGLVYEWSGNLAVTVIMHFVIDFVSGLYIFLNYGNNKSKAINS